MHIKGFHLLGLNYANPSSSTCIHFNITITYDLTSPKSLLNINQAAV